jgi:transmembrane sensor
MLIVGAGFAAVMLSSQERMIRTERGERREVALSDGSVVQVDPETRLRVNYEAGARRVYLERGRALFHVAKNPQRPFFVQAESTTVRAVGTAFSVEREDQSDVVIIVAEGKVAVFPTHSPAIESLDSAPAAGPRDLGRKNLPASSTRSMIASRSSSAIFLGANQQITVARTGNAEAIRAVDSRRALAWADGRLVFDNSPVGDAIREFNRYNSIQIIVKDAALARRPISGVFNAADPESFAAFIQSVAPVRIGHAVGADITIEPTK